MLQIAKRLAALINDDPGMKAIMTRNTDHFVSLGGRVAIARRAKAHLLVSIHADAWIKASARGSSVFCLSVLNEMKSVNRLHKKHVEQAGFAVLKGQGIPSILVETAFISNPTEEKLLINGRHQQKIAQAIYDGIRKQVAANPSLLTG